MRWAILLLVFAQGLLAQNLKDTFVLDKSKPFAYLAFDHVGPRKPVQRGEDTNGLWIRVINNCRVPILLRAASAPHGELGSILEDEVVPEVPMLQVVSEQGISAINEEQRDRNETLKHKPDGYDFEVSGVIHVQPGGEALFSVPQNHVGRFWFMRVRFALDVDGSSIATGPFVDLDFHDYDLPKLKK